MENKIKILYSLLLAILFGVKVNASDSLITITKYKQKQFKIQLNTNIDIASNCFNTKLYSTLFNGKYLEENIKNQVSERSAQYNRIGYDFDTELKIQFKPKRLLKNYFKWMELSFSDRNHIHAGFSRDALNMVLYGNSPFVGKKADLSNLTANVLQYQQVRIGFASDTNDSLKSKFIFGLSLLNGQRNIFFNAPQFSIETDASGYEIYTDLNYQVNHVPSSMSKFGTNNGLGFSLDIDFKENWTLSTNKNYINQLHVSLRDIGFIQWNEKSYNVMVDTSFIYKGLNINSLKDSLISPFSSDSLKSTFYNTKQNTYSTSLPGYVLIENGLQISQKHYAGIGIQHRTFAAYRLQYRLTYEYRFNNKSSLGLLLTKGGYNNYGLNIYSRIIINKITQLNIGVNNFQGTLSYAKSGSIGGFLTWIYWF